jgi:4-hydroxy-3-methylbut-2-enyl diphosphate reductase IspH
MVGTRYARMCLPHLIPGNNRVLNNSLNFFDFISMACSDRFNLEYIEDELLPRLYEVLAEREGLLPGQECTFTIHEIVHVFQDIKELDFASMPQKITLYSQTTKSTDKFYAIKNELIAKGFEVRANDTICRQVSNRDEELRKFVTNYDRIIFVSGRKSSNGKILYDVCRQHNVNTYFVSASSEIDATMFHANDTVGICGATSTPMWLMEEVKNKLQSL